MKAAKPLRKTLLLAITCMALLGSCAGRPDTGLTAIRAANLVELQVRLQAAKPDVMLFRNRGPFAVTELPNYSVHMGGSERIIGDLFLPSHPGRTPLVILLHGFENSKEDHGYQAMHLATWGMASLAVQLPNRGPWIRNGNTLVRLARLVRENPGLIDKRIDPERIILVGHSFGGSAVSVALGNGAPVAGGILLDPAGVSRAIPGYLKKVTRPMVSLNSDERVTLTRNRGYFYQYVPGNIGSVSITGAAHEDAQFPLERAPRPEDSDADPVEEIQITFVSALTAATFSIAFTGKLDYVWESFAESLKTEKMFGAMRK
jgi:pimeloyl-ACP methyl ester carboxylesterase